MDLILFTPDLLVNVPKIDEQHRALIKKFNEVGDAVWDGRGRDEIGKLIGFMVDYVQFHFADEEATMLDCAYPGYSVQKSAHDDFVRRVGEIRKKFDG
ncbi:MAG: hemerythrin domain-containing protein, partial [Pseudomonadota bacterium]